ncbi:MAG: hypothetical protein DRP90_00890 [Planctomycetota bacterium]|nr:MAG: hypothetical protein DRP90_00890 [Planctomycetota bacterium]
MKPFEMVIIVSAGFVALVYVLLYLAKRTGVSEEECDGDPAKCSGCPMAGGCSAGKRLTRPGPGD